MSHAWIPVVAGALARSDGRWLMHRRPAEKHHGGLWEFPGGKVEAQEVPINSLVRELREELGIIVDPSQCRPVGFAEERKASGDLPIVIFLYMIEVWDGIPDALEGGAVGWFRPEQVLMLEKPPLDIELARQLFQKG